MSIDSSELGSSISLVLTAPLLAALGASRSIVPRAIAGLPMPAFPVADARTIVAATPVMIPAMFGGAMVAAAETYGADVVLVRHGFHPETLDTVFYDVVTRGPVPTAPVACCLYRHPDGRLWLVPAKLARDEPGPVYALTTAGLVSSTRPPWRDDFERSDGLSRAARHTVLDLRAR